MLPAQIAASAAADRQYLRPRKMVAVS